MATLALGAAGAAIGGAFIPALSIGGTTLLSGAAIGWSAGLFLGNQLFAEDQVVKGPRKDDLAQTTSEYGKPIPKVWGTYSLGGTVIWAPDITEHKHEKDVGGKGGPSQTQVTYTYTADFAVLLCEGPILGVRRIWADSKLIYDFSDDTTATSIRASNKAAPNVRIYTGTETQEPDALIEADKGVGNVSAHRGYAYVVFEDLQLEDYGNRRPQITAEVIEEGTTTQGKHIDTYRILEAAARLRTPYVDDEFILVAGGDGGDLHVLAPDGTYIKNTGKVNDGSGSIWGVWLEGEELFVTDHHSGEVRVYDRALLSPGGGAPSENLLRVLDNSSSTIDQFWTVSHANGYIYVGVASSGDEAFYAFDPNDTGLTPVEAYGPIGAIDDPRSVIADDEYVYVSCSTGGSYVFRVYSRTDGSVVRDIGDRLDRWGSVVEDKGDYYTIARHDGPGDDPDKAQVRKYSKGLETLEETVEISPPSGEDIDSIKGAALKDGVVYIVADAVSDGGTEVWVYAFTETTTVQQATLSDVVSEVMQDAGVGVGDIDVSALTDSVRGYARTRQMTARAAIEPLMPVHRFDVAEIDWQLKGVDRGGSSVVTIVDDDLAAHEAGSDMPDEDVITRTQELELPRRITVRFPDVNADYEQGAAESKRLITDAVNEVSVDTAEILTPDEAVQAADVMLYSRWLERTKHAFSASMEYADLAPGDVVTLDVGGVQYLVRITRTAIEGNLVQFEAAAEESAVYTQSRQSQSASVSKQTLSLLGPTLAMPLDIPILRSTDNEAGYYLAMAGYLSGWPGAVWYRSDDDGDTYDSIITADTEVTIGEATTALGDGKTTVRDSSASVTVDLRSGSLSSTNDAGLLNLVNVALVGDEVLAFRDVAQNADGTYTIDGPMLRGLHGTDRNTASHSAQERFVLLDSSTLLRVPMDLNNINTSRKYKPVTVGRLVQETSPQSFSNTAVGLKPLSPAHLKAHSNGDGTYDVTWVRRTRYGGEWRDNVGAPLGEDSESYRVIVEDSGGSEKSNTTTSNQNATVSASSTDVVKVAQISADVGDGYFSEVTVP